MSQYDFGDLESPLSGTALINTHLEPWRDAIHSSHSGSSRPSYAVAGMLWIDTTTNPWILKIFDGTDDITVGNINTSTNLFTPAGVTSYGGSAGGTANALTLTPTTALTAYAAGVSYDFLVTATNTAAAPTLNISSLGTKTIKCSTGGGKVNLPIGALQNGMIASVVYDGTDFILLNVRANNKSSDIATASSVNLNNANGDYILLTGTTTVNDFILDEGVEKTCVCAGSFIITDGSGNSPQDIICIGGANITTAAGDIFKIRGEASGATRIISYTVAANTPGVGGSADVLLGSYSASNATSVDIGSGLDLNAVIDASYDVYELHIVSAIPQNDNADLYLRTDANGGASFDSGSTDYVYGCIGIDSASDTILSIRSGGAAQIEIINDVGSAAGESCNAVIKIFNPANSSLKTQIEYTGITEDGEGSVRFFTGGGMRDSAAIVDSFRILFNNGNISADFYLYAYKTS